jgi:Family of unknown function (DUF5670)
MWKSGTDRIHCGGANLIAAMAVACRMPVARRQSPVAPRFQRLGISRRRHPPRAWSRPPRDARSWNDKHNLERTMLETIAVILVLLWLLGLVSSYTMGGLIHILLVIAVVVILVRLIQGRRVL